MSTSRRPAAVAGLAFGLATLAVIASGCSVTSPAVITTPYAASDGTNADLDGVHFRNFLLVGEAKGKPGVVVGAVTTDDTQPVQVRLAVLDTPGGNSLGHADLTVQPSQLITIGTGDKSVSLQIDSVPVQPGAVLTLHAQTAAGGTEFALPVLPQTNEYATISPTASSSASPSPSGSAAVSPSPTG